MLRNALSAAAELSNAQASAQISAEWEALDLAPGFLDGTGQERGVSPVLDATSPVGDIGPHMNAEIHRRILSGAFAEVPASEAEKTAALKASLDNPRSQAVESGWNVGPKPAPREKPESEEDDFFATDLTRANEEGWQISGEPRQGPNVWNRESRRRR